MSTMQSWCHKKQQPKRFQLTPQQRQAARDRADAKRMARPAPLYPVDLPPGWHRGTITAIIDGITTVLDVHQPPSGPRGRRPRCDSMELRIDGKSVAIGGWGVVGKALKQAAPRQTPRRYATTMTAEGHNT